jgi:hypothetical protein
MTSDSEKLDYWAMAFRLGLAIVTWIVILCVVGLKGMGGPGGAILTAAFLAFAALLGELSGGFWRMVSGRSRRIR